MELTACDAGGPIRAGDNVYCFGPYVARCNRNGCGCNMISLQDADFKDLPLQRIQVMTFEILGVAYVVDPAG